MDECMEERITLALDIERKTVDSCCSAKLCSTVDPLVLLWLNQTREDDLDKGPGQRVKRRRRADRSDIDIKKIVKDLLTPVSTTTSSSGSSSIGRKRSLGDESSPEVSSSNISPEPNNVVTTTGVSPVPSLAPSDIGEVDLEFWDLDINESSNANTIASTSGNHLSLSFSRTD
ncbi:uncharacterized protein TNCT_692531 [Trichonephila clavata]|uniref:Uncharacterized protein n=1 Tax=Trichonephila clavata TaxID=2740835 RepID=A0A8X6FKP1_TRICU|nr:uncharacterized protein TNCT_692531 [Trichonephila clavata]